MAQARKKKNSPVMPEQVAGYAQEVLRGGSSLICAVMAIYLVVALASFDSRDAAWSHTSLTDQINNLAGRSGAWFADIALHFLGYAAYLLPIGLLYLGWRLWLGSHSADNQLNQWTGERIMFCALGIAVTLGSGSGLATLMLGTEYDFGSGGGIAGDFTSGYLVQTFSVAFSGLFLMILLLAGLSLATGIHWLDALDAFGRALWALPGSLLRAVSVIGSGTPDRRRQSETPPADHRAYEQHMPETAPGTQTPASGATDHAPGQTNDYQPTATEVSHDSGHSGNTSNDTKEPGEYIGEMQDQTASMRQDRRREPTISDMEININTSTDDTPRDLPTLTLLDMPPDDSHGYTAETLYSMRQHLEKLLRDFGVAVEVVNAIPGPVITSFELAPAPGVKVSQITKLDKDLARGLSAPSVRVVEVIPGKSVVGLEIPNEQRATIYLSEILGSNHYRRSDSPLTLGLGKDIAGNPVVANLASMPHLLVAGTTGSGKSVALNAMLLSILFKSTPRDVKMIMIDPKMLELSIYEDIPHLLVPVVTDMKEAYNALRWCINEMERRYRLMAAMKVRNIESFNRKIGEAIDAGNPLPDPLQQVDGREDVEPLNTMPFIVVVIDELADLMMATSKKVEEPIVRLAQKARAAGIHLILATQRPSVDVITGLIKSNIRTRIAFQVASKVDSRTILDQMGAETLLGHGDMLFLPPGKGFPERVHGAFVADHEVQQVVDSIRQSGSPSYNDHVLESQQINRTVNVDEEGTAAKEGENDPLFKQAQEIVADSRRIRAADLQRKFRITYNRATRMLDVMEQNGMVGPVKNGSREVLKPVKKKA